MTIERLVGVRVSDEAGYADYRRGMTPILAEYGGRFVVDVRVSEVLLAPEDATFGRLFTLRFPDRASHDAFFADPRYLEVRRVHFEPSVEAVAALGTYEVL